MIHILDSDTINKIAAGEVVERPASVIKELVENAIDAGATAITVEIKSGGKALIRVTDNGCGIEQSEVRTAFLRHSTSKIKNADDLQQTKTLGFRGEALSSISSVAEVEMLTKRRSELNGTRYAISGGVETACETVGCPDGTTFLINNLFYNTPARRKFMKSDTTEAGYVGEIMERVAVSHPEVAFKYINQGRTALQTAGNGKLKDVIYSIYGRDIAAALLDIEYNSEDISISGYIGKPIIARGNRNLENYYINGRYVKNNVINKAIEDAFSPYLMNHKYPFTALHITIPTEQIDVNVHPAKLEVRFENAERIYTVINTVIAEVLSGKNMIPQIDEPVIRNLSSLKKNDYIKPTPEPFERKRLNTNFSEHIVREDKPVYNVTPNNIQVNKLLSDNTRDVKPMSDNAQSVKELDNVRTVNTVPGDLQDAKSVSESLNTDNVTSENLLNNNTNNDLSIYSKLSGDLPVINTSKIEQLSIFEEDDRNVFNKNNFRIIGQVFLTYWLVEIDNMLYIIDQHAAHEKVLYEQICEKLDNGEHPVQQLSPPMIIRLSLKEEAVLKENMDRIAALGFVIEHFGGSEYAVSGVPTDIPGLKEENSVHSFITLMSEESSAKAPEEINHRLATIACKAAVKGNNKISFMEAEELINQLMTLKNPFNCPHGRPVIISMSKSELERKFKR